MSPTQGSDGLLYAGDSISSNFVLLTTVACFVLSVCGKGSIVVYYIKSILGRVCNTHSSSENISFWI